jgi:hypothetical protein
MLWFIVFFVVLPAVLFVVGLGHSHMTRQSLEKAVPRALDPAENVVFSAHVWAHPGFSFMALSRTGNGFLVVSNIRAILGRWAFWPLWRTTYEIRLEDIAQVSMTTFAGITSVHVETANGETWFLPYKRWLWPFGGPAQELKQALEKAPE